ncbi:hypothetical protein BU196_29315 [Streptomyces sp. CBMA370]|nr:hypothetical protein [Streptomyces sp. CBMA370]
MRHPEQAFSTCVRKNGFPEYPDPDPATGERKLTDEEKAKYHTTEFQAVALKCTPAAVATGTADGATEKGTSRGWWAPRA